MRADLRFGKVQRKLLEFQVFFERYGMKAVVSRRHFVRVPVACAHAALAARPHDLRGLRAPSTAIDNESRGSVVDVSKGNALFKECRSRGRDGWHRTCIVR